MLADEVKLVKSSNEFKVSGCLASETSGALHGNVSPATPWNIGHLHARSLFFLKRAVSGKGAPSGSAWLDGIDPARHNDPRFEPSLDRTTGGCGHVRFPRVPRSRGPLTQHLAPIDGASGRVPVRTRLGTRERVFGLPIPPCTIARQGAGVSARCCTVGPVA